MQGILRDLTKVPPTGIQDTILRGSEQVFVFTSNHQSFLPWLCSFLPEISDLIFENIAFHQSNGEVNHSEAVTAAVDVKTLSNGDNSALTAERWVWQTRKNHGANSIELRRVIIQRFLCNIAENAHTNCIYCVLYSSWKNSLDLPFLVPKYVACIILFLNLLHYRRGTNLFIYFCFFGVETKRLFIN